MSQNYLSRRRFLRVCTGTGLGVFAAPLFANRKSLLERELSLFNTHTEESLRCTYWADGAYVASTLDEINWVLRDHRTDDIHPIAPELLELLYTLNRMVDGKQPFQVISGYRSPATNAMLRTKSNSVGRKSLHMSGKAIDVRIPGCDLQQLQKAALALGAGGVGYYPTAEFIHVDVGRVRSW